MAKLRVWTAQMHIARRCVDMLDITVKSGDKTFAPSWAIVMDHKNGKITDEQYTEEYKRMMRETAKANPGRWNELMHSGSVTLACYCKAGDFCHRLILVELLKIVGEHIGIEVVYEGEVV